MSKQHPDVEDVDRRLSETQQFIYEQIKPILDAHEERIETLEDENQRLRAQLNKAGGKKEKIADIIAFADNSRGDTPAIKLTAKEIRGATGCSRRYAYDLMDELPQEYDWFLTPGEMTQYGSLEIDNTDERRLGVDFEGVHSAGCPVNKFTTPNRNRRE